MVEVGELFCEQSGCSSDLETSAEEQCLRYLHSYHGQSLATLKTYLEHESWELMPVRDGFSLDNLHEFCFLHAAQEAARSEKMLPSSSSPLKTLSENEISFTPDAPDPFAVEVAVQSRFVVFQNKCWMQIQTYVWCSVRAMCSRCYFITENSFFVWSDYYATGLGCLSPW